MSYNDKDVDRVLALTDKAKDLTIESCNNLHNYLEQFSLSEQWEIAQKVTTKIAERGKK